MTLAYDTFGRLVMTLGSGETFVGVTIMRCFPLSAPSELVSFCTDHGKEILCLASLDELAPNERELVEQELARREFVPVIKRIVSVTAGAEPTTWEVETDRGPMRFVLPSEDNVRLLGAFGVLITDAEGIRYHVVDTRKLDRHGRALVSQYV